MLCEVCEEREANVFIKKIVGNKKREYNLCEQCAAKMVGSLDIPNFISPSQDDIFGSLSDMLMGFGDIGKLDHIDEEKKCPSCNSTFTDIQHTGRLGCAQCYETFEENLASLLQRLQGSSQHSGKEPVGTEKRNQFNKMKKELLKAIEKEEYERAAVIRDKIRDLERQNAKVKSRGQ